MLITIHNKVNANTRCHFPSMTGKKSKNFTSFLCQPAEEETLITKSVKMVNLYGGQSGSSSQKK